LIQWGLFQEENKSQRRKSEVHEQHNFVADHVMKIARDQDLLSSTATLLQYYRLVYPIFIPFSEAPRPLATKKSPDQHPNIPGE
jgi:hypothetical protein